MLLEHIFIATFTTVYTSPTKNKMTGKELKGPKAYKQKKKGIKNDRRRETGQLHKYQFALSLKELKHLEVTFTVSFVTLGTKETNVSN